MGSTMHSNQAVRMLLTERDELMPVLHKTATDDFDRPTVCCGWSVRDVLGHCGAALHRLAVGNLHDFSPAENELDVLERRSWPLHDVLEELQDSYPAASAAITAADGELDIIALGEWVHGGDVRDALGLSLAYESPGVEEALEVLAQSGRVARTQQVHITLPDREFALGTPIEGKPAGRLRTDVATLIRLYTGRPTDPAKYRLSGAEAADLVIYG